MTAPRSHQPSSTVSQMLPFSNPRTVDSTRPNVMVRGEGCYVYNEHGDAYLEMMAGLWCAGLGFDNDAITRAVTHQLRTLPFYHGFLGKATRPTLDLADRLVAITPEHMNRVVFANSGSEAVETATKLVTYYHDALGRPGRNRIIARDQAYHGSGTTSAALTAMDYCHDGFGLPVERVLRTGSPDYHQCAEPGEAERDFSRRRGRELDRLIIDHDPATIGAFIGEPVQASGGVVLPPDGYWDEIQNVLARHDLLLVADEVVCGFHRTGNPFGCDTYAIRPDMMILAKQLSAGFLPISAVMLADRLYPPIADAAAVRGVFGHGFTCSGHPVCAAAALAAIDEYDRLDVAGCVRRAGNALRVRLDELATETGVANTRCVGLLAGVALADDVCRRHLNRSAADTAAAIVRECEARGVIFRAAGTVIAICPPMIIQDSELDLMAAVLRDAIRTVLDLEPYGSRSGSGSRD